MSSFKNIRTFEATIIHKGGGTRRYRSGYFYACMILIIQRFCTPAWSVNAPTALVVIVSGKGRTASFFLPKLNFSEMTITEKRVGTCKACGQPTNLSVQDILNNFFENFNGDNIQEDLLDWFTLALSSEEMNPWDHIQRSNLAYLFKNIRDLILNLESIHSKSSSK